MRSARAEQDFKTDLSARNRIFSFLVLTSSFLFYTHAATIPSQVRRSFVRLAFILVQHDALTPARPLIVPARSRTRDAPPPGGRPHRSAGPRSSPAPPSRVRAHVPVRLEHAPAELEHRAGAHLHPPRRARDRRAVHGQHRPRGFALDRLERARLERRPGSFVERSFFGGGGGDCFLLRRRRRRRDDGPVRGGEPGPLDGDEEEEESNGERSDARVELLRPPGGRPRDVGGPAARGEG